MRIKSVLQLLIIAVIFSSCKKDMDDYLHGKWMRIDNNTQILTFGYKGIDDWFTLFLGYQTESDGNQRPIEYLGEYRMENQNDSISIHWMHSSSTFSPKFKFSLKGPLLEIGDLVDGTDAIIEFQKIK